MWQTVIRAETKSEDHATASVECYNRFDVLEQDGLFENLSGTSPNTQYTNKIKPKPKNKTVLPRKNTELKLDGRMLTIMADSHQSW